MHHFIETLEAHPNHNERPAFVGELASTLTECAMTCQACADACLAEPSVEQLWQCIRTDLACAEVTQALANVLTQQTTTNSGILSALAEACQIICRNCATECEQHAEKHAHCKHCAEICRECETQCGQLTRG